jgi:peptide/nickel transport system ATP-binding protein
VVESGPAKDVLDRGYEPKHPYSQGLLRAIPSGEDIREGRRLVVIDGDVPDLSRLGSGCQFVDRCSGREHFCAEGEPGLETVFEGHRVRCWRHLRHPAEVASAK